MKYIVFKTSSGKYGVKKEDGVRAIKTFDDEKEAKEYAEEMTNKANKTVKKLLQKINLLLNKVMI